MFSSKHMRVKCSRVNISWEQKCTHENISWEHRTRTFFTHTIVSWKSSIQILISALPRHRFLLSQTTRTNRKGFYTSTIENKSCEHFEEFNGFVRVRRTVYRYAQKVWTHTPYFKFFKNIKKYLFYGGVFTKL